MRRCVGRSRKIDLHVMCAGQFLVRDARKVFLADVLDGGDFALHLDDDFLHTFNELIDRLFTAPVIEDERGAVIADVGIHFGSLRLSWFMAGSTPRESSSSRPCTYWSDF